MYIKMKMLKAEYDNDVKRCWKTKYPQKDFLVCLLSLYLKAHHSAPVYKKYSCLNTNSGNLKICILHCTKNEVFY